MPFLSTTSPTVLTVRELLKGKTIARALTNATLNSYTLTGRTLDVGGTYPRASHYRFIEVRAASIIDVNLSADTNPHVVARAEHLPFEANTFDVVLAFNLVEHLARPRLFYHEARRVLRPGGTFLGTVPFLVPVHDDPFDYARYTDQMLLGEVEAAGFCSVAVTAVGSGPFTAALNIVGSAIPTSIRIMCFILCRWLDRVVVWIDSNHGAKKYPLAYIFEGTISDNSG